MIRIFSLLLLIASIGYSEPIRVAVAASMQDAMKEIVASFNESSECEAQLIVGSSGKLTVQIMNGAPYDLFFSADMMYPEKIAQRHNGVVRTYAEGRLALSIPGRKGVDLKMLADDDIRHIAIANPAVAPYGRAAIEALKNTGLYDDVRHKLVYAENVSQAAHYLKSGAADAGLIALSLLVPGDKPGEESWVMIDRELHEHLFHGYVVMSDPAHNTCVESFSAFMSKQTSVSILRAHGFTIPSIRRANRP